MRWACRTSSPSGASTRQRPVPPACRECCNAAARQLAPFHSQVTVQFSSRSGGLWLILMPIPKIAVPLKLYHDAKQTNGTSVHKKQTQRSLEDAAILRRYDEQ